jgi:hypothetical protein
MYENLLDIETEVLNKHNVQPNEDWEIDVFDENDRLITTLFKDKNTH